MPGKKLFTIFNDIFLHLNLTFENLIFSLEVTLFLWKFQAMMRYDPYNTIVYRTKYTSLFSNGRESSSLLHISLSFSVFFLPNVSLARSYVLYKWPVSFVLGFFFRLFLHCYFLFSSFHIFSYQLNQYGMFILWYFSKLNLLKIFL